jgi:hypothetical protein
MIATEVSMQEYLDAVEEQEQSQLLEVFFLINS